MTNFEKIKGRPRWAGFCHNPAIMSDDVFIRVLLLRLGDLRSDHECVAIRVQDIVEKFFRREALHFFLS